MIPPETTSEFLVQVTVVAGLPVEVQVRVHQELSPLVSESMVGVILRIVTLPEEQRFTLCGPSNNCVFF